MKRDTNPLPGTSKNQDGRAMKMDIPLNGLIGVPVYNEAQSLQKVVDDLCKPREG